MVGVGSGAMVGSFGYVSGELFYDVHSGNELEGREDWWMVVVGGSGIHLPWSFTHSACRYRKS